MISCLSGMYHITSPFDLLFSSQLTKSVIRNQKYCYFVFKAFIWFIRLDELGQENKLLVSATPTDPIFPGRHNIFDKIKH